MNFKLQENVNLADFTTFKIGGVAKFFCEATSVNQLPEIFSWLKANNLPHIILSGGSNTIFDDGTYNGLVLKISIKGIEVIYETDEFSIVKAGSGEVWDGFVKRMVDMNLSGVESLSGIPGNCGAAPVQNIGAYGQEVQETIESVEAYDTKENNIKPIHNAECRFRYRDSIFKSDQKGRYIITAVSFKLSKEPPQVPKYNDVINYFEAHNIIRPTLVQIRRAILEIRKNKFVDPSVTPNSGSFFKNPLVNSVVAGKIRELYPDIKLFPEDTKIFPLGNNKYKIAAGWLIDELGLKGIELERVKVDPSHALVLENKGGASQKDLMVLIKDIQTKVKNKFGIELEPEPVIINF